MKIKKLPLMLVLAVSCTAVFAFMMGGTAFANPNQSQACVVCHYLDPTVSMTVTKTGQTTTTETYSVSGSTAYDAAEGWGVFTSAGVATGKYGYSVGSFTLNKDSATYTVYWSNDSNLGLGPNPGKGGTENTTVTTASSGTGETTVPSVPSGLAATAFSSSQINLTWTASTDNVGVTGYTIEKATASGGTYTLAGTSTTPSYSATGLTASTAYWFRVRANDAANNNSGNSSTATATTLAGGTPPPTTGAYSQVTGTVHNMATAGTGVCASCHVAHNAFGDNLWARPIGTTFTGTKALCYSCHDGTIANEQYVFSATYAQHVNDCNTCHDPHNNTNGMFLTLPVATLCNSCHLSDLGMSHPVNVVATMVPADAAFDPPTDMSGTRLYNSAGTSTTGGTYVKCLTCHTAHGGVAGTHLNTMDYSAASAALCTNCHP